MELIVIKMPQKRELVGSISSRSSLDTGSLVTRVFLWLRHT